VTPSSSGLAHEEKAQNTNNKNIIIRRKSFFKNRVGHRRYMQKNRGETSSKEKGQNS
jgi:hypothetical protein